MQTEVTCFSLLFFAPSLPGEGFFILIAVKPTGLQLMGSSLSASENNIMF